MRAFAADKFRSDPRRQNNSLTYSVIFKPNGHRHFFKMHTYHGKADIKPRVGADFFDLPNVHCPAVSAGRTKQAFVLLSQKVLANIETALAAM